MPDLRELRDNAWAIAAPAVPGVLLAIVLTAVLRVGGAALIRATPLGFTSALFREVAAPRRLHVLVSTMPPSRSR